VKRLAVVAHTGLFGEVIGSSLERLAARSGITVVVRERITWDETHFRSLIGRILASQPEAIAVHTGDAALGLFIKQLREAGYRGLVTAGFNFESEAVRKTGGAALEGVIYTYPASEASDPAEYRTFAAEYAKRFGAEPNNNAAMAYDVMLMLDAAVTGCGGANPDCLLKHFAGLGAYDGLGGRLTITRDRIPLRPYGLKEYAGGKYRWIEKHAEAAE